MAVASSKGLFDFKPAGKVDDDIIEWTNNNRSPEEQAIWGKYHDLATQHTDDTEVDDQILEAYRDACKLGRKKFLSFPEYQEAAKKVDTREIAVPTSHDGDFEVPVFIYTPKSLVGNSKNAAYIYAHGGGVIAAAASDLKPALDFLAVQCGVVVFNVDYRLAPETKSPNNVKDFYEVIKY